ncbi:RluA family pseudouridine synthase [Salibacterium qingdaonense]|uniref:Pseudouridine synthase n=1 Tax=Salibacterium qingdaonense TaxID=266892 RepID=A0A1I4IZ85_9BACI|nr:RluA family pseudouridine synthase [Salibacterium qingdaonense]SFL59317.1 ribosomal large subunit pseudouridine synthase D [Salibacterium qingdaonense]
MDNYHTWQVTKEDAGTRIDKFLAGSGSGWSRTKVQQWAGEEKILVNQNVVKSNYILRDGDKVEVNEKEEEENPLLPESLPLDIYHEDEDIIVINKPKGMVVHPAPGHRGGTLVNALLHHCTTLSSVNGEERPGIVHRLDKDTSGLMVCAKNDNAHLHLAAQLQEKQMKRVYQAIVHGSIVHDTGVIEAPIGRDTGDRQRMAVTDYHSKDAVTHFRVMERFEEFTMVECRLETGRTHQIRVHFSYIGHPAAGDPKYTRKKTTGLSSQALHASGLSLIHPVHEEWMNWEAPLPEEMNVMLEDLRKKD